MGVKLQARDRLKKEAKLLPLVFFGYRFEIETRKGLSATCKWALGRFPFNQNFRKFRTVSDEWSGNFLGKFPENPEIVEFLKSEPFNQTSRGGKSNGTKFPGIMLTVY